MKPTIARIYHRKFKSVTDASAFIDSAALIEDRISAVDMRYRLYQSDEDPLIVYEVWEYPDEDAMEWVQSSMEGASAVPRRFSPETSLTTASVKVSIDKSE